MCHWPCLSPGNGPSGISLSFLLSGHWPHYTGANSDELLHARLMEQSHLSLVEQDLDFLTEVNKKSSWYIYVLSVHIHTFLGLLGPLAVAVSVCLSVWNFLNSAPQHILSGPSRFSILFYLKCSSSQNMFMDKDKSKSWRPWFWSGKSDCLLN